MKEIPDAILCEGCDAVYQRRRLRRREVATCTRCGTELARHAGDQSARLLPLTIASLILFAIANLFPIVEIQIQAQRSQTTLLGAVQVLGVEGMSVVALLVLATTLLFPLAHLCILFYLLMPIARQRRPPGFTVLVRIMQSLEPWGMIEVFLLGVLVAIVKLSSLAEVVAGPALWAFMSLTVLLTSVMTFDPRAFWDMAFDPHTRKGDGALRAAPPSEGARTKASDVDRGATATTAPRTETKP